MNGKTRECGGLNWLASYTIAQYEERYGKATVLYMLQEQERTAYVNKILELDELLGGEPDKHRNQQVALDAWTPFQDRPPTLVEKYADELDALPAEEFARLREIMEERARQRLLKQQQAQAEKANASIKTVPFASKINTAVTDSGIESTIELGPPVTTHQQEPVALKSFEELGRVAEEDVPLYTKPAAFEEATDAG